MSNRVEKRHNRSSSMKTAQSLLLVSNILSRAVEMAPCSSCARRGSSCLVSDSDSSRCSECVRRKVGDCDIQGPSNAQLRRLASQQIKLEEELDEAAEEFERAGARYRRLQRQKKIWSEKVMRAVARGIDNLEELEALERREEEEKRSSEAAAAVVPTTAASTFAEPSAGKFYPLS
jgi:hypothetical protein